ncbi:maleate isomerase [Frankia sp. EI5c]|uniref:maleate cis-trans isomerase family protein n=1 Tax=Frankia sp. EI5c TaxID=683316 RepID=UPI0007C2443F|nr:IgiC [Frankia sp. EI5c]OAA21000.1 maleate isomerase [Frankia sp. EI5c]
MSGDPLGYRAKFGVVTPSVNTVVQPEYDAMRPAGVTNHIARIHIPEKPIDGDAGFQELVHAIDRGLDDAVERVLSCEPTCVLMGVSIEAVYQGGVAAARAIERRLAARFGELTLIHAADALPAALRALGVDDGPVSLVTPYMPDADAHLKGFVEELGYGYQQAIHLEAPTPLQISHIPEAVVRRALTELAGGRPRAIVQFGANLSVARLAGEAERWLELPVVAVNTATYWHALRRHGILDRREGFGSLLLQH